MGAPTKKLPRVLTLPRFDRLNFSSWDTAVSKSAAAARPGLLPRLPCPEVLLSANAGYFLTVSDTKITLLAIDVKGCVRFRTRDRGPAGP
ncbi:hypothetical protein OIU74_019608 [Salix koriyanagi]|uniref:Uncharacterized protein n=1 Tax=Salix koriyanagi TaxID=2511006 RepID=A0A9Q0P4P1_9ROSI|nr:hypothetical protein OIU74_019608 [Salix koriyanagi]